jgi:hypothetical protein
MTGTDLFLIGEIPVSGKKYFKPGRNPLAGIIADFPVRSRWCLRTT